MLVYFLMTLRLLGWTCSLLPLCRILIYTKFNQLILHSLKNFGGGVVWVFVFVVVVVIVCQQW